MIPAVIFAALVTEDRKFGVSLTANVNKAFELYSSGYADHILVVGGWNIEMFDGSHSVAEAVYNWLIKEKCLPKEDVSWRGESTNCIGNVVVDILSFLVDNLADNLFIVCQKQESARVLLTAQACGIKVKRVPTACKLSFLAKFVELIYFLMTLVDPKASDIVWRLPQAYRLWRRNKTRR